jgi:anti-sigma regulatory factor (Ser/Thr protein kinase)
VAAACELTLLNRLSEIPDTMRRVEDFAEQHGVPAAAVQALKLALEESLVNIVTHGYQDTDAHRIDVAVDIRDGDIRLELTDDGIPFDPRTVPPPDVSKPADERPLGGLGVWLVKQMVDDVQYRRDGRRNKLLLVKRWT